MKTSQFENVDLQDLRKMTADDQARLGIDVLDRDGTVHIHCTTCGRSWSPEPSSTGHLSAVQLICPHRCNL